MEEVRPRRWRWWRVAWKNDKSMNRMIEFENDIYSVEDHCSSPHRSSARVVPTRTDSKLSRSSELSHSTVNCHSGWRFVFSAEPCSTKNKTPTPASNTSSFCFFHFKGKKKPSHNTTKKITHTNNSTTTNTTSPNVSSTCQIRHHCRRCHSHRFHRLSSLQQQQAIVTDQLCRQLDSHSVLVDCRADTSTSTINSIIDNTSKQNQHRALLWSIDHSATHCT